MKPIALLALVATTLVVAVTAPGASAATHSKKCSTPSGFVTGPFFADGVRVRRISCSGGRKLVARWGRTSDCVRAPTGKASDKTCRVGRYRCTYRQKGGEESEVSRTTCKRRGTRRVVSFNFGS